MPEVVKLLFRLKQFQDERRRTVTSLIIMEAGASISAHKHQGVEECHVLEGDFHLNGQALGAGDYHCAQAGSDHRDLYTKDGALLLVISGSSGEKNVRDSPH